MAAVKKQIRPQGGDPTEHAPGGSAEQFRAIANSIPNIAWSADSDGAIDYLNDWWYQYSGLTPQQSLRNGFLDAIHPDDVERVKQGWSRTLETGEVNPIECRIRRHDGSYRWHLGRGVPVRDAKRRVIRWFGTATDIDDMKKVQSQLAEREAWFHTLFDTIPLSAAVIDQETLEFLQFNNAAAANLGYTREEFCKLTVFDIDPAYSAQRQRRDLQRLRSGEMIVLEAKHRTKSGALRDVVVYLRFMMMNGRAVANSVWEDVTERKAAEAALLQSEKLASVGRMAATVAHEINNPLEAVTHCVYLTRVNPSLPAELKQHLEIAERELYRVAHLAKRTLGFYRDSRKPAMVDVRTLVDEVVELYQPNFTRKRVHVKIEHGGQCSAIIAIAGEVRQVISNLLTNALDASEPNATVRIRTNDVLLRDVKYVRITVADTGMGIPPASLSRIFDPFFTTKDAIGTGLGLWVSRKIVDNQQGRIRVRSVQGKGTVFSVFFHCAEQTGHPEM